MTLGLHAAFAATFPWFDDYRWGWAFDTDGEGAPAFKLWPAPGGARGTLEIFMAGATHEQWVAVKAWLVRECRPKWAVPARRILAERGHRSRNPNAPWAHLAPRGGA